jgi:CRISPR/Cas system CMR-associated protein Cmr1 (group 7 of RAMP superfamily)
MELDFNFKSKESSKEDDIQALCEMRGVGRNAPLSVQLKAIDEEYHYLIEQGRSDKAEYIQQLYAFKSKQTLKVTSFTCSIHMQILYILL